MAIALVFLVFYAGFIHGQFSGSDEAGVYYVTESLYERHSLEIPVQIHAHVGQDNKLYSPFAVGQSVLALPLYGAAKIARSLLPEAWATALAGRRIRSFFVMPSPDKERLAVALPPGTRVVDRSRFAGTLEIFFVSLFAPIVSSLLAMAIFVLLRQMQVTPRSALLTTFLVCVCSYPASMSVYFLRHTAETLFLILAFIQLRQFLDTGRVRALALGSSFASMTFLVRFPSVLAGPAVGLYVVHLLWERHRDTERPWLPDVLAVTVPLTLCLGLHSWVNYAKWGTLIASPMTVAGFERSESFSTALFGFLLSPGISVFAYSPLLLLFPWTFRAAWQRWRWECIVVGVLALTELLYFSNYRFWTGLYSAPGPRYLFPGCVFMLLALGPWLDRGIGRWSRVGLIGLAVIGAALQGVLLIVRWGVVDAREKYAAYDPEFSFLFNLEASPILASGRAVADGFINTWIWKLAHGWPGFEAAPLVAIGLTTLWIGTSIVGGVWLWRTIGRRNPAPPEDTAPQTDGPKPVGSTA